MESQKSKKKVPKELEGIDEKLLKRFTEDPERFFSQLLPIGAGLTVET